MAYQAPTFVQSTRYAISQTRKSGPISRRGITTSPTRPLPVKAPTASQAIDGNATSAESDAKKNPAAAEERENAEAGTEPSDITETYVAKEVGETLFKECARQADYTIPQAFEKSGEVPKNDATEDIGQGTGWWYDSKFIA